MTLLEWAKKFELSFIELPDFSMFTDPLDTTIRDVLRGQNHVWESKGTELVGKEFVDGGVFVDCGAHWGYYSLLVAKRAKHVYAFEANPCNFRYLQLNILLNGLEAKVTAYPIAVWDSVANLESASVPSQNTGGRGTAPHDKENVIQSTTLDTLFQPYDVDFIKIDCEGADGRILRGGERLLRESEPKLLIEGPDKDFLERLGYQVILDCTSGCGPLSFWRKK